VAGGEALLSPAVTRRLIEAFVAGPQRAPADPAALAALTAREREVLALVAGGLSNDEIAASLVISKATARTHVSRIMTKVAARDRAQLVVLAYESGLVKPSPQVNRRATIRSKPVRRAGVAALAVAAYPRADLPGPAQVLLRYDDREGWLPPS
jgi:DNA-binding CsgD family transcriptional regulator